MCIVNFSHSIRTCRFLIQGLLIIVGVSSAVMVVIVPKLYGLFNSNPSMRMLQNRNVFAFRYFPLGDDEVLSSLVGDGLKSPSQSMCKDDETLNRLRKRLVDSARMIDHLQRILHSHNITAPPPGQDEDRADSKSISGRVAGRGKPYTISQSLSDGKR